MACSLSRSVRSGRRPARRSSCPAWRSRGWVCSARPAPEPGSAARRRPRPGAPGARPARPSGSRFERRGRDSRGRRGGINVRTTAGTPPTRPRPRDGRAREQRPSASELGTSELGTSPDALPVDRARGVRRPRLRRPSTPARQPGRPPSPVRAGQGQRDRFGGLPRSWRIYWCLPNSSATQMRPSGPRTHAMPIVSKSPSTFSRWCGEAIQMSWAPNGLSSGPPTRMFSARYA